MAGAAVRRALSGGALNGALGRGARLARGIALALLVPFGLYLTAAAILARMPVNAGWREPTHGTTIFVLSNGAHTGIVLPAGPGRWRAYGWGDRDFYLNTPRWQDVRFNTALSALVGSGSTLLHVDRLGDFVADANWRPLRLRAEEYRRLTRFIAATQAPGASLPGYGPDDNFYPAHGGYSAFVTCNVWSGRALAAAGVRVGLWTPFADDVMRWVPKP